MAERDYPVGHPASSDYSGVAYQDPHAIFGRDYMSGHPAHGGKNVRDVDTPDGMRAAHNAHVQDLIELAAVKSLPPLIDPETKEPIALLPEELAHCYRVRKLLRPDLADCITREYQLEPEKDAPAVDSKGQLTAEQQALNIIIARGYTPERARELLDKYGVPDTLAESEKDAHR